MIEEWPRFDDRAIVYAIGRLLTDVTTLTPQLAREPMSRVIQRCLMADPAKRFQTLVELRWALTSAGGATHTHPRVGDLKWPAIEKGIGYLALGKWNEALQQLVSVRDDKREAFLSRAKQIALRYGADPITGGPIAPRAPERATWLRSWPDAAADGARLEAAHDPHAALSLYKSIGLDPAHHGPHMLAIARTSLAVRHYRQALEYAAKAPYGVESLSIEAKARLGQREPAHALEIIDRWRVLAPDDPSACYQRGKALLGLSRLPEAREAFEEALARDGTMIEAMVLRREVDRWIAKHRSVVGVQQQASVSPELLALIGAEPAAAIDALCAPAYAADAMAQLMLAELLVGERRYADSLLCYDRAAAEFPEARRGKARAFLALGRPADALDALGEAKDMATSDLRTLIAKATATRST